jgi:hypothetical protein
MNHTLVIDSSPLNKETIDYQLHETMRDQLGLDF